MKFNKFIKEKRKNCNLTQEKAADKIGVSVNTIQNWENENYTVPRMDIIPDIAKTYKVSVYDIFRVIAADMEVQAERGKLNEIFPDKMSQLYLTREEQDVLGCYYLKYVGGKEICSFKNDSYEMARIINRLKELKLISFGKKWIGQSHFVGEDGLSITSLGEFVCRIIEKEPNQLFDVCNCAPADMFSIYENHYWDVKSYILRAFLNCDEYEIKDTDISTLCVTDFMSEYYEKKITSYEDEMSLSTSKNKTMVSSELLTENERKAIRVSDSNWDDMLKFDENVLKPLGVLKTKKDEKIKTDAEKEILDATHKDFVLKVLEETGMANGKIQYVVINKSVYCSYFLSLNRLKEVFGEYIEIFEKDCDGETKSFVRLNNKGKEIINMIRG